MMAHRLLLQRSSPLTNQASSRVFGNAAWQRYASTTTSIASSAEKQGVKLYQYAICPFCNRVKALLAYSNTDYEAIEVNPLTKSEIQWSKEYRKVPIATVNGEAVFGSDEIVQALLEEPQVRSRLATKWTGDNDTHHSTTIMTLEDFTNEHAVQWTTFANDELASLLYPNMARSWGDAWTAFGYVHQVPTFGTLQRVAIQSAGSLAMHLAASRVKKRRNITDEQAALDQALATMEQELKVSHSATAAAKDFLSGRPAPHMGDVALYGVLRSIEGLPAHTRAVMERQGPLRDWYQRMAHVVERT